MKKRTFKYINPTENGMVKFKVSRKQFKEIFPHRKFNIFSKAEFFYSESKITYHKFSNALGVIVSVLMFPYVLVMNGLGNMKEVFEEYYDLFNEKKTGNYSSDVIYRKYGELERDTYFKLEKIYKSQVKGDK